MSERGPRGFPGLDGRDGKDGTNGKDADPALIALLVREAVAAIPRPADGKSVTLQDVEPTIAAHVAEAISKIPRPADGKSVTIDELRPIVDQAVAAAVAALPKPKNGKNGVDGKDGKRGPMGPMPDHRWVGTELQFEAPDGTWGPLIDLRGPRGPAGYGGGGGGRTLTPAMLSPATNDVPSSFVVVQGDSFALATLDQMLLWLGGIEPDYTVYVDGEPVTVGGETVTVS